MSNLSFDALQDDQFNQIPSISCRLQFNILGVLHRATMHAFTVDEARSYLVLRQSVVKDFAENEAGFKSMESTFEVE